MNRNIEVQVAYDKTNKGVDIRNPSSANFLIDSEDRANYNATTVYEGTPLITAANFTITKPGQNLVTGFFTRLAMTELCLTWNIYNVSAIAGNNTTGVSVRNVSTNTTVNYTVTLPTGNYTVKTALDAFVALLNSSVVPNGLFTGAPAPDRAGKRAIQITNTHEFAFYRTTPLPPSPSPFTPNLTQCLGFAVQEDLTSVLRQTSWTAYKPCLLAYKYIDITCPQLASQQKLKDATTSTFDAIDVIYRFNFVNDDAFPVTYDDYGYPILPGYKPFNIKRTIPFPKQVRWDPLLPLGNLQFITYTDKETVLRYSEFDVDEEFEFKLLMLVSEV